MSWRETLHKVVLPDGRKLIGASFRSVPFLVNAAERGGGRRIVTHEFPLRDDPHVEDLGRAARTFTIEGYLVGDDYVKQRDALLSALEDTAGPGELIHPYYGVRRAICSSVTAKESIADGGFVQFSISFADAPEAATIPVDAVDFVERVNKSATLAKTASDDQFLEVYNVIGLPGFALASAQATIESLSAGLQLAGAPVMRTVQELASLTQQTQLLTASASALVHTPEAILSSFAEALGGLIDSTADALDILGALFSIYDTPTGSPVSPITATRARELANQQAINAALKGAVAIEAARKAVAVVFDSIDDALLTRDEVTARLDDQLFEAGNTAYPALLDLRASLVSAIPGDVQHARILTIDQKTSIPSIALSHRLYGSTDEELDLVARNGSRFPAFMSGELKVRSNV